MLEQSLFELATATCFSSSGLAASIRQRLLAPSCASDAIQRQSFHRECLLHLRKDLDNDYPRRFRINDMDHSLEALWPNSIFFAEKGRELPILDHLFERLFVEDGDLIRYRDDNVSGYVRSASRLDPALVAAWRLAKRIHERPSFQPHDLQRIVTAQQPFLSPLPEADKPFAENHVHLGGVHYDGLVLMAGLGDALGDLVNEPALHPLISLQRLAYCLLMEADHTQADDDQQQAKLLKQNYRQALGKGWQAREVVRINWQWLAEKQPEHADAKNPRWLRRQIARSYVVGDISKAWLWFLIWCWVRYQTPTCTNETRMAIFYLLNSLMHMRKQLLMDGQGLTRFVGVYNNLARRNIGDQQHTTDATRRIFQGPKDVAELKVTHSQFSPKNVSAFLGQLSKGTGLAPIQAFKRIPAWQQREQHQSFERWHYCLHFIRSKQSRNNPAHAWSEVHSIEQKLMSEANWQRPELLNTSEHWAGRLQPTHWVRGLDVAGDENLVKIEVFAPAIRWLRQGLQSKSQRFTASPGLHLSVHAGEDYAHPLSGMRHIDETVRFCSMRSGDRLGHALALGIPPETWMERQGDAILPAEEHLDNLVWAWHYACEMSSRLPLATQVIPLLARQIQQLCQYVLLEKSTYDNSNAVAATPDVLFTAWKLRRNCYHYLSRHLVSPIKDPKLEIAVPDLDRFMTSKTSLPSIDSQATKLYLRRWKNIIDPAHEKIAVQLNIRDNSECRIRIQLPESYRENKCDYDKALNIINMTVTPLELEFMHALQDWLLEKYDTLGLVIEANPTSNVYVARLASHCEHPVFRWYPPDESTLKPGGSNNRFGLRRGPIKFCVNTDDPGIMPTTLRTEFSLLREAALAHGVSRTQAENWLERIRIFGIEQFRQKHLPLWN